MALVAHVNGGTLGMARRLARRDEGIDAGRRAATGEKSTRTLRIAKPAPKPVDRDQFDLARAARHQPGALVDVVAGGHEVGQHTGPGRRRWDKAETARVFQTCRERQNFARYPLDDVCDRLAVLGRTFK